MSEVLLIPAGVRVEGGTSMVSIGWPLISIVNARRGGPVDIVLVDNDVAPVR